ncbi:tripartite tricarboxylate transporter substrate binding protein [Parapusillimonas sp. SGNA-6]|nr:tripartite tricarboxylate transporter substrate binding protein [Parapusillimonas sp. SGNA-6]
MTVTRRTLLKSAGALPLLGLVKPSHAQQYPSKPIHIVVPASAATSIDVVARFFTEPLSKRLNTPVVAENKPGTGGLIAYTGVAKTQPDGYTLMLAGIPMYLLPLLSKGTATFDAQADFTPVARVARVSLGLVVAHDSPYQTLGDLLKAMKDNTSGVTYSSQGIGSTAHLCGVRFTHMSGGQAQHIPYRSTTTATTDVAGGRVTFTIQTGPAILGLIRSGKLRLLAVSGAQRWEQFPDIPTIAEAGVPGYEMSSWLDFVAPKGTPETVLQLLSREFTEIAQTEAFKTFCMNQIISPDVVGYKEVAAQMPSEAAKWKELVKLAGLA